jgi:hypothetical protein
MFIREPFIPGLELGERLYTRAVAPILAARFSGLRYAAARVGRGSDVLGYDTPRSTDHHWGPKLELFLTDEDVTRHGAAIHQILADELPFEIDGYPTHFADLHIDGGHLERTTTRPIAHQVVVWTVAGFFRARLGIDPAAPLAPVDWLLLPQQALLTVTAGRVFRDDLGTLTAARARLAWYPRDLWCYLLAAQWRRIAQEEAFMGRCGQVGDELGSRLVAARLLRDLMRLAFLMERTYAPYTKWFGTAFARLVSATTLGPLFERTLAAAVWTEREPPLVAALEALAAMHNDLGLTPPLPARASGYYSRPFRVIHGDRFAEALLGAIADPAVRRLPPHVGAIDQWADSTDILDRRHRRARLAGLYAEEASTPVRE